MLINKTIINLKTFRTNNKILNKINRIMHFKDYRNNSNKVIKKVINKVVSS